MNTTAPSSSSRPARSGECPGSSRRTRLGLGSLLAAATLTVLSAQYYGRTDPTLKISRQPTDSTFEQGQTATLTVGVEAIDPYYPFDNDKKDQTPSFDTQWLKNGNRITGATQTTLTLPNAQLSDSGSYQVVVSNNRGWVASNIVTLTIMPALVPTVLWPLGNFMRNVGETVTFDLVAAGSANLKYQWRKNGVTIPGVTQSRLTLVNLSFADSGNYDAFVSNSRGTSLSPVAHLTVLGSASPSPVFAAPAAPVVLGIVKQPTSLTVAPRGVANFPVTASGENLTHQWKKNGADLAGATTATLTLSDVAAADTGFYSVTIWGDGGQIESDTAILTVATGAASRLTNLSTRGFVATGDTLTTGFVWRGSGTKNLLIRAIGPTLTRFGLPGALGNPRLEIIADGASSPLFANDDWSASPAPQHVVAAAAAVGAFALDASSRDAAVLVTLAPNAARSHTARITASDATAQGVVLAEVYDTDAASAPDRLVAVSTLGYVGPGERSLVSGFTIAGQAPKRLLIRAVGPGLAPFGIGGGLVDPQIFVHAGGLEAPVAKNDDWDGTDGEEAVFTAAGAFALDPGSKDAALVVALPPGSYTVTISGAGGATGTALVEIYDLDP
jgi:hypothetical protein